MQSAASVQCGAHCGQQVLPVVAQWFTLTTSLLEVRSGLEKLKERYTDEAIQVHQHSSALASNYITPFFQLCIPEIRQILDRLG